MFVLLDPVNSCIIFVVVLSVSLAMLDNGSFVSPLIAFEPETLTRSRATVAEQNRTSMSLGVNITSREILDAYQSVLNGGSIDWALFTYEKGSNDLKLQETGDGGLEELQEEFSDGR